MTGSSRLSGESGNGLVADTLKIEILTGEEAAAAAIEAGEIQPGESLPNEYYIQEVDPQPHGYVLSPTVSIIVLTLGDGGEQALTLEQFISIWSPSPPEGGDHLSEVPWLFEREGDFVVSLKEQYLP